MGQASDVLVILPHVCVDSRDRESVRESERIREQKDRSGDEKIDTRTGKLDETVKMMQLLDPISLSERFSFSVCNQASISFNNTIVMASNLPIEFMIF